MTTNVGTIDRTFRAALGLGLLYFAFFSGASLFDAPLYQYGAAVIGVVMLAASAFKLCPLYSLIGVKTCREC